MTSLAAAVDLPPGVAFTLWTAVLTLALWAAIDTLARRSTDLHNDPDTYEAPLGLDSSRGSDATTSKENAA